jgi:hypothetical protein
VRKLKCSKMKLCFVLYINWSVKLLVISTCVFFDWCFLWQTVSSYSKSWRWLYHLSESVFWNMGFTVTVLMKKQWYWHDSRFTFVILYHEIQYHRSFFCLFKWILEFIGVPRIKYWKTCHMCITSVNASWFTADLF